MSYFIKNNQNTNNYLFRNLKRSLLTMQPIKLFSTDLQKSLNDCSFERIKITPNGIIKLVLPLPARKENCEFTLKFLNDKIESLVENIKEEDKSIEKVVFYSNGRLIKN